MGRNAGRSSWRPCALACALVGALAGTLVTSCATMDAESRENLDAPGESADGSGATEAQQRPPSPPPRKPKPGDGTLKGRVSLNAAGTPVTIASFLTQTGATSVDLEAGGERFPIAPDGTFDVRLDSGTFRIDHLELNGPGDRRRALFFAPVLVDVEGAAACLGRFDLAWGSVKDLIRLETPRSQLTDACPQDTSARTEKAPELPLPELADPWWVRMLSVPYLAVAPQLAGTFSVPFAAGGRLQLMREPQSFGSGWLSAQATFLPTSTRFTGALEWGPWQGFVAIGPLGGIVGDHPIVGGTLVLGPMKRELALAVRCELELVSGLPPAQTWSLNLQVSPFAFLGALL